MDIFRPLRQPLGLVLSCGLLALACRPETAVRAPLPPALRDPQAVIVDGLAPANGIDGQGSLFLGDGWGRTEGDGKDPDWGSMAWVVGREATVHALLPPAAGELDFFVRCLPFPWAAGSPVQQMELLVSDRVAGRFELIGNWQDVRFPLPELPRNQMATLRLRFRHALKPQEVGAGADARSLAAAVTQLAIVPRAVREPRPFLAAHSFDPATGKVVLPAGGGLRLPLPPASQVRLRLALRDRCKGCELSFELTGPGAAVQPLPAEQDGQTLTASVSTAPDSLQSLWLRVTAPPDAPSDATAELTLESTTVAAQLGETHAEPPHVFVYMIDTLRADALGPYGGRPALTPHMNAFAEEAVTYLQTRASSTWTLPSVVSLLTGLYPDRHAVTEGLLEYDPNRLRSLSGLLGDRGYRTVGISHSFIISPVYGLDSGFDRFYYHDYLNAGPLRSQEARGLLASWLSEQADGSPLFAYLHTVDPHAPYAPPAEFRAGAAGPALASAPEEGLPGVLAARGQGADPAAVARLRSLYEGEVSYADQEFGRFVHLLKWLGLWERSYVILVGDHGEEFAEHGAFEHGTNLFEETLRVPLLVKYPRQRWAGARIDRAVSLVDVAPTVLAGLSPEAGQELDGRVLPGPDTPGRDLPAYFAVNPLRREQAPVNLRGLTVDRLKCIENLARVDTAGRPAPRFVGFDLAADPGERRPLPDGALERCRQVLESWTRSRKAVARQRKNIREVTPETLERLRALGYLK